MSTEKEALLRYLVGDLVEAILKDGGSRESNDGLVAAVEKAKAHLVQLRASNAILLEREPSSPTVAARVSALLRLLQQWQDAAKYERVNFELGVALGHAGREGLLQQTRNALAGRLDF